MVKSVHYRAAGTSAFPHENEDRRKPTSILRNTLDGIHPSLTRVFLPWALRHPGHLRSFVRLARAFRRSELSRAKARAAGLTVPPFMILSVTNRCNLSCKGCFAAAVGTIGKETPPANARSPDRQAAGLNPPGQRQLLTPEHWRSIIAEASALGVFVFVIAGGEPFLFPELVEFCREFRDRFFIILTNGTAMKEKDYDLLKRSGNIAIMVSIEGGRDMTDARRGEGVCQQAMATLERLRRTGTLTGVSVTITRMNFRYWMDTGHLDRFIDRGIHLGALIEYIPLAPAGAYSSSTTTGTALTDTAAAHAPTPGPGDHETKHTGTGWTGSDHHLMLTPGERAEFREIIVEYRKNRPIYLIHSPGDEEFFGGCVSAGRGFAHVTPAGDLTPCPVSNVATHNLTTSSLREALASPLFENIRENEHLLETAGMPCALFAHPEEVDELARRVGAYRTG